MNTASLHRNEAPPLALFHGALEERASTFRASGVLDDAELLVVDALADRFGVTDADVLLALALAVRAPRVGHVGVDLRGVADQVDEEQSFYRGNDEQGGAPIAVAWHEDPPRWEAAVRVSGAVGASNDPATRDRPFVLQPVADGRHLLMTRRMWREQERLADALLAMATTPPTHMVAADFVEARLPELKIDGQGADAVRVAAARRLTVVTGGPGTGKTYSIKRLLTLLLEAHPPDAERPLRVELAAPTGKAAVRMAEAMAEDLEKLNLPAPVLGQLRGLQPRTLHKLLGMHPDGTSRHGREKPLDADVIVVDEVSMVDLTLMRRLVEAVPPGARLILLGDRDQLASVEAGTVLSDIVRGALEAGASGPLAASVVPFEKSHRFQDAPTVATIAQCLQRRDDEEVFRARELMTGDETVPDPVKRVSYLEAPHDGRPSSDQLDGLAKAYIAEEGFAARLAALLRNHGPLTDALKAPETHRDLLDAFARYRVLAVHRRGPLGVSGLERELARKVRDTLTKAMQERLEKRNRPESKASKDAKPNVAALPVRAGHWLGQPVLVTENTYDVGLMNGDIGLVLPTSAGLAAVFPVVRDGRPATKEVALARLPAHQGALAMTVHKSQGSQFEHVALVLAGRASPIQTRELVYTGITRTSSRLDWLGDPDELEAALRRRVVRASGLAELLWQR